MFNEGFKEKDEAEIPLPEKIASEFLDLLNQVYVDVEICTITSKYGLVAKQVSSIMLRTLVVP